LPDYPFFVADFSARNDYPHPGVCMPHLPSRGSGTVIELQPSDIGIASFHITQRAFSGTLFPFTRDCSEGRLLGLLRKVPCNLCNLEGWLLDWATSRAKLESSALGTGGPLGGPPDGPTFSIHMVGSFGPWRGRTTGSTPQPQPQPPRVMSWPQKFRPGQPYNQAFFHVNNRGQSKLKSLPLSDST
jgi:hypothetical protein